MASRKTQKQPSLDTDRIIQGEAVSVLETLPDESVDLVFADPPYNLQLEGELRRPNNTRVDGVDDNWDKFDSFKTYDEFTHAWLAQAKRVLKPTGTFVRV